MSRLRPIIRKVDANHAEIIDTFRKLGWTVRSTAIIGKGFPDAVAGKFGFNVLVEIKDGTLPPSKRKLTEDEEDFIREWKGAVIVIESINDVIEFDRKRSRR